jgi:hypothetical protein
MYRSSKKIVVSPSESCAGIQNCSSDSSDNDIPHCAK